jgi:hypothetical protein
MLIGMHSYAPKWDQLSVFGRLFLLVLASVGLYTLYFAAISLVQLRSLTKALADSARSKTLASLSRRSANVQQATVGAFYFFGLTFFLEIQNAYWTPESNYRPVGLMVLENFAEYFRFAAFVFLVFTILHSIHWFVSARVRSAALRTALNDPI